MSVTETVKPSIRVRKRSAWSVIAALILIFGIVASAVGATYWRGYLHNQQQQNLNTTVSSVSSALHSQLERYGDVTAVARTIFITDPFIKNSDLNTWFKTLGAQGRYKALNGLGRVVPVVPSGLATFEANAAKDPLSMGTPSAGFTIVPQGSRPQYCLIETGVFQAAPSNSSAFALSQGMDLCALPTNTALRLAEDTGNFAVMSMQIGQQTLNKVVKQTYGSSSAPAGIKGFLGLNIMLMVAPYYYLGVSPPTEAGRQQEIAGWVISLVDPIELMTSALGNRDNLNLTLYRQNTDSPRALVASLGSESGPNLLRKTVEIQSDGTWFVKIAMPATLTAFSVNAQSLGVFGAGLLLTLLLFLVVLLLTRSRQDALTLAEEKTGELVHVTMHDGLTGLPNRALILDRSEQLLSRARREHAPVAVLIIDLDNFKYINDTLGSRKGDQLLNAVAGRLSSILRDTDTVGRLGADEFVVLAEGDSLRAGPEVVAERLMDILREPFHLGEEGLPYTLSASIGIAIGDRPTAADLLRDADVALYQAKSMGKHCYVVFHPEMQTAVQNLVELERDLRSALSGDQFFLVYQPTLDLKDETMIGVEALIRWQHPTRGIVEPEGFVAQMEETGMIVEVGRWVIREACRQAREWHDKGYNISVAVNVSGRQLDSDKMVTDVHDALVATDLDPTALILEITETTLMRDAVATADRLAQLKKLGVRIAIDDFGTGYSSLAYLRQFPVDALKIDRTFVSEMIGSSEAKVLIRTLVQLGKSLGLETVAEGIEDQQQLIHLQNENCDVGQGFLFSQPLDAASLEAFIIRWVGTVSRSGRARVATSKRLGSSKPGSAAVTDITERSAKASSQ